MSFPLRQGTILPRWSLLRLPCTTTAAMMAQSTRMPQAALHRSTPPSLALGACHLTRMAMHCRKMWSQESQLVVVLSLYSLHQAIALTTVGAVALGVTLTLELKQTWRMGVSTPLLTVHSLLLAIVVALLLVPTHHSRPPLHWSELASITHKWHRYLRSISGLFGLNNITTLTKCAHIWHHCATMSTAAFQGLLLWQWIYFVFFDAILTH